MAEMMCNTFCQNQTVAIPSTHQDYSTRPVSWTEITFTTLWRSISEGFIKYLKQELLLMDNPRRSAHLTTLWAAQ